MKIVILGAGGHASDLLELIEREQPERDLEKLTIGEGATIAAGAVARDVPPRTVVPAK